MEKNKLGFRFTSWVYSLSMILAICIGAPVACNPNPPRQPAVKQKEPSQGTKEDLDSGQKPDAGKPKEEPLDSTPNDALKQQPPDMPSDSTKVPPPQNTGTEQQQNRNPPVMDDNEADEAPVSQNPDDSSQSNNPPSRSVTYKAFFKPSEPNVPDKRHGSWNLNCLSLVNGAGTQIASPVCNKKLLDGCHVFHGENQGVSKSIGAELLDGSIEVLLDVTRGAERCKNGAVATDDVAGFRYLEADLSNTKAISYSSTTNETDNRFKCAKKNVDGKFIYKICMEDNIALYESDPAIWDFNDFVLTIESSTDLVISGLTCEANVGLFELPEGSCK